MDKWFLTILNMSLTGAFVIAVICLVRLPLKKAPKTIAYGLWAVALVAVLSGGFAVNRMIHAPLIEMNMIYEENPAFFFKDMKLLWGQTVYYETEMNNIGKGKKIGYATDAYGTWHIYELSGYNHDYLLAVESDDVWRVMSIYPPEQPIKQYILENATKQQKMERMLSVTLYRDGRAKLATAAISSYLLKNPYDYTFTDGELIIHADGDSMIARFTVIDHNTLVFKEASVPLFADKDARYVSVPNTSLYEPRKWLDYYNLDDQMPWKGSLKLKLPEYPNTVFHWMQGAVTAVDSGGEKTLFGGMPIWNVYLADLTGDGLPEFCATVSCGSGIIAEHIRVYDYANGVLYELSDRMYYDYALYLDNGQLMVKQAKYRELQSNPIANGELVIIDGELTAIGIDRTRQDMAGHERK